MNVEKRGAAVCGGDGTLTVVSYQKQKEFLGDSCIVVPILFSFDFSYFVFSTFFPLSFVCGGLQCCFLQ